MRRLEEPASASGLARQLGLPRQKVNYHLRELEKGGLVDPVEERRRGNCAERIVRATARSYLISPEALGSLGSDPEEIQDRLSAAYLVATAGQAVRDIGAMQGRAEEAGKRLATLTLTSEVRFRDAAARNAFAEDLANAVAGYRLSWGGEWEGESRIEIFEPGRHLRTTWPSMNKDDAGRPVLLSVDYHLEGRGGRTALRLVHSGFGREAGWDDEYEGVQTGWAFELRSLRHYLEHHRGRDRHVTFVVGPKNGLTGEQVWTRVLRDGFGAEDPKGLAEGDRYTLAVGEGTVFEGTVLDHQPSRQLAGTVDGLGDGIFYIEVFASRPHLWLATWGDDGEAVRRFEAPWTEMLSRLFAGDGTGSRA